MSTREEHLVRLLSERGLTVATAESLTAGMLAASLASVPGASAVLRGGLVVYATDLKHTLAGVPLDVLELHGAVAAETAAELARGARSRCGADLGLGLTGVAGPDSQEGHPPGTVFLGLAGPGPDVAVVELHLVGDRQQVRRSACEAAVDKVVECVGNDPEG